MARTIVTIEERNGALTAKLAKAGAQYPQARAPVALGCSHAALPPLDSPENVRAYGEALRTALMRHPAIGSALQQIFLAADHAPQVLCFEIDATEGEQIRWEVLCDDTGHFLALDGRCQMGRIAEEVSTREASIRPFTPPCRIVAFLSAAGVDATPEWEGIARALEGARSQQLPVEAHVYIGQQGLLDLIVAEIQQGKYPEVAAHPMPATAVELERVLKAWPPHVVHFFCHGSVGFGEHYLELATVVEHEQDAASGSVLLNVDELSSSGSFDDAWVVVLNCCEGGRPAGGLHSMAFRVVARGGVPAAFGMQEPVAAGDANAFSENLYPELLDALRVAIQSPEGAAPVVVNLTSAIGPPRRALRDLHRNAPQNFVRWSLPVLYLHDQPLQVHRPTGGRSAAEAAELRTRAETVAGFLRAFPPDTPETLRTLVLAELDRAPAVPQAMRPGRYGEFEPR
jgi:hypothetical protein